MKLVNLTPHAIVIVGDDAKSTVVSTSGNIARCAATSESAGEFLGIPLTRTTFGEVVGLPDPQPDTLYIVSMLVRNAVPERKDVASPGELVRDADGKPIGCRGLAVN